nr:MBOAT family O-acyltransferase [Ureibacillus xyleni]
MSSLFFYSWWNVAYLPLLLGSIVFNYFYGKFLSSKSSKLLLSFGIIVNVLVLGYFKYMDFFITNVNFLFSTTFELFHLLLPLGISFFTFQQIAYLVDSYRKESKDYSILDYSLFISFFPQLIAGPIVYHKDMLPQFVNSENRRINIQNIATGIFIFVLGLFKKVGIADTFAKWANSGFANSDNLTFVEGWITSLSYTMQLYFDFSGYSDMAIGLGLMFNIRLPLNFNSPYKSLSIQEFWRRWHMTLNQFLTKYLYFPLGGSKKGTTRTYINILIIFAVSGIWHGAGWTFVIWGMMHGIASCINRLWSKFGFRLPTFFAWFVTFNFVNIAWVFFRATSVQQAIDVLKSMFDVKNLLSTNYLAEQMMLFHTPTEFLGFSFSLVYFITFMMIACLIIALFTKNTWELSQLRFNSIIGAVYVAAIITIATYVVFSNFSSSEFIYFNF